MNTQKKYICCHRIIANGSDNQPMQVISTHESAHWFIKPLVTKKGDNVLNHEWYVMEVQLDYFQSIKWNRMMTSLDAAWQRPLAHLNSRDDAITWNKEHPFYTEALSIISQS